jgi:hypothetical protein
MSRIKHYALMIAAIFGAQMPVVSQGNSTQQEAVGNEVLSRVARIQQESQSQNKTPEFLDNQQISQWNNWSDWQDWQDWNNWYN